LRIGYLSEVTAEIAVALKNAVVDDIATEFDRQLTLMIERVDSLISLMNSETITIIIIIIIINIQNVKLNILHLETTTARTARLAVPSNSNPSLD
jgi:hypothetical protein